LATVERLLDSAGFELTAAPRVTFAEHPMRRGRPIVVANRLWRLAVSDAFATVTLPLGLNWSRPGATFDLSDRRQRARCYEVTLREGIATTCCGMSTARCSSTFGVNWYFPRGSCRLATGDRWNPPMNGLTDFQAEVARCSSRCRPPTGSCWLVEEHSSHRGSRLARRRTWTSSASVGAPT